MNGNEKSNSTFSILAFFQHMRTLKVVQEVQSYLRLRPGRMCALFASYQSADQIESPSFHSILHTVSHICAACISHWTYLHILVTHKGGQFCLFLLNSVEQGWTFNNNPPPDGFYLHFSFRNNPTGANCTLSTNFFLVLWYSYLFAKDVGPSCFFQSCPNSCKYDKGNPY